LPDPPGSCLSWDSSRVRPSVDMTSDVPAVSAEMGPKTRLRRAAATRRARSVLAVSLRLDGSPSVARELVASRCRPWDSLHFQPPATRDPKITAREEPFPQRVSHPSKDPPRRQPHRVTAAVAFLWFHSRHEPVRFRDARGARSIGPPARLPPCGGTPKTCASCTTRGSRPPRSRTTDHEGWGCVDRRRRDGWGRALAEARAVFACLHGTRERQLRTRSSNRPRAPLGEALIGKPISTSPAHLASQARFPEPCAPGASEEASSSRGSPRRSAVPGPPEGEPGTRAGSVLRRAAEAMRRWECERRDARESGLAPPPTDAVASDSHQQCLTWSSPLQGVAPSTSPYRGHAVASASTTYPSMGFVPLRSLGLRLAPGLPGPAVDGRGPTPLRAPSLSRRDTAAGESDGESAEPPGRNAPKDARAGASRRSPWGC
jgi:hypothetical protein